MNRKLIIISLITILLLTSATSWALEINDQLQADLEQVKKLEQVYVARVIDGDTIETAGGRTIRLIGVDTPETKHPSQPLEYYGKEAAKFTNQQVANQTVYLEYDVQKKDKYNRVLAYVFLADGTFFNAQLVHDGYAKLLTIPPNVKYATLLQQLATEARKAERGLWAKENQPAPEELPVISWQEADKYIGQRAVVTGKIVTTYDSGEAVFLNFAEDYSTTFTAVVFASDKYKFEVDLTSYYLDKQVKVRGLIKEYQGAPEIIVETTKQIEAVD